MHEVSVFVYNLILLNKDFVLLFAWILKYLLNKNSYYSDVLIFVKKCFKQPFILLI